MAAASTAAAMDCSPPRQVNGQAVILRDSPRGDGVTEILLQLRSQNMQVMAGCLAAVGGCRSRRDADSRATVLREVQEETGLQAGVVLPPTKFAQGEKCDWFVMKLHEPTFVAAQDSHECGDLASLLPQLPSATPACFGHAWLPLRDLPAISRSLPFMPGLVGRADAAVRHLRDLERNGLDLTDGQVVSAVLQGGGIDGSGELAPPVPDPFGALRTQVEYYLSDANLRRDRFFHERISASEGGWLELALIMSCNKVKAMGVTQEDVVAALADSDLEVREDLSAVRRPGNAPLPTLEPKAKGGFRGARGGGRGGYTGRKGGQAQGGHSHEDANANSADAWSNWRRGGCAGGKGGEPRVAEAEKEAAQGGCAGGKGAQAQQAEEEKEAAQGGHAGDEGGQPQEARKEEGAAIGGVD